MPEGNSHESIKIEQPNQQPRHDRPKHEQPRHEQPKREQPRQEQPRYEQPRRQETAPRNNSGNGSPTPGRGPRR